MRWRRGLVALGACFAVSCSLSDLTDYEIEECEPVLASRGAEQDVCSRLGGLGVDDCHAYRCDAQTRRCVLAPRDADRDGQVSTACGGDDCDDGDADVGRDFPEICSEDGPFVDNDCDGVVDQTLGFSLLESLPVQRATDVRVDVVGGEVLASYVQKRAEGQCIQLLPSHSATGSGCGFGPHAEGAYLPRQPSAAAVGKTGYGVAYVETANGCPMGALAYRVVDGAGAAGVTQLACDQGVALPSLSVGSGGRMATIAFVEAPLATRDDALDDCEAAEPAPLRLTSVQLPDDSGALVGEPWSVPVTSSTLAIRPPALARVGEQLLLGAPADSAARVWLVDEVARSAGAGVAIPGFTAARTVSLAVDGERVAAVAQLGCKPQSLAFALGHYDESKRALRFTYERTLLESRALLADPKVVWSRRRGEWLVTWLEAGPRIAALRLAGDGASVGEPFVLLDGAEVAALSEDAGLLGFSSARGDAGFWRGEVGCAAK